MTTDIGEDLHRTRTVESVATLPSAPARSINRVAVDTNLIIESKITSRHSSKHGQENVEDALESNEKVDQKTIREEDTIPDGGLRAWRVVLGAFFTQFTAFGTASSW